LCILGYQSLLDLQFCIEVGNFFSRQDLRDSVLQDSIMLMLRVRKRFKLLIKEKLEFNEDIEVPDKLIPSKFEEGSTFLD
jgi:hypothetical protein